MTYGLIVAGTVVVLVLLAALLVIGGPARGPLYCSACGHRLDAHTRADYVPADADPFGPPIGRCSVTGCTVPAQSPSGTCDAYA